MKTQSRILNVLMNGILVGQLEKTAGGGLAFKYDLQWLSSSNARPLSLSLPLATQQFFGDIVHHFFDNLLPDNPQVRSRIQRCFKVATDQPFDLLAKIGKECVGAIQLASGEVTEDSNKILFQPLKEKEIATILRDTQHYPLGMTDESDDFRISIAGAQEKTAFLHWQGKWCKPLGITPTTHIFKLPLGIIQYQQLDLRDSCENEWLCSQIVAAFGLPVANCEIQQFEEIKVLVVERFDRVLSSDGKRLLRLPQEDMCQALGVSSHLKYQADGGPGIVSIMQLLLNSTEPERYRELFFRAQVVFWLLAAIDGHAKNFSIHIDAAGAFRLTPLYDIMSAYPLIASKQLHAKKIKMAMALKGKTNHYHWLAGLQRRYFLNTAKESKYSMQKAEQIIDELLAKVEPVIDEVSKKMPSAFPKKISQPIFDGLLEAKRGLVL